MDPSNNAAHVFDSHAKTYQDKYMETGLYHDSFDRFCEALSTPRAEVLEIGCGPGNITRYLLQRRPEMQILGTDLAPRMLELAQANNPDATFQLLDARAIATIGRPFDGIVCGFCLPYLTPEETLDLIHDAAAMLRKDGVLYLSTMEDDPGNSRCQTSSTAPYQQLFIQYYQAQFLTEALKANGFAIMHIGRARYPEPDGKITTDVMIVAKKTSPVR